MIHSSGKRGMYGADTQTVHCRAGEGIIQGIFSGDIRQASSPGNFRYLKKGDFSHTFKIFLELSEGIFQSSLSKTSVKRENRFGKGWEFSRSKTSQFTCYKPKYLLIIIRIYFSKKDGLPFNTD
jgi:hypothetical protein